MDNTNSSDDWYVSFDVSVEDFNLIKRSLMVNKRTLEANISKATKEKALGNIGVMRYCVEEINTLLGHLSNAEKVRVEQDAE
jgi:DNA-directed RNA polymerase subunit N (RpoN/RPB10)